jgi:membrane-bound lytic murein transglycosylase D
MITKLRLLFICLFIGLKLQAQQVPSIEVPDEMEFAGMKLKLTSGAKELLQKDITLISKNSKYFQTKVDLANLYFPLIEKVFEEESFPKDFKYLALQESSLIGDAVSKSNAVGYWQFKKESAVEVGLRVDDKIDERMNVIASTRGAARYLKRNNQTFNNWVYALLSYNLGLGGAKTQIDPSNVGAKKMTIDENTHWYVIRFLAHKLIYQHAIGNSSKVDTVLVEYINGSNKSINEIAIENNLDKEIIASYNKWLKTTVIPEDKIYSVVLVVPMSQVATYTKTSTVSQTDKREAKPKKEKFPSAADINLKTMSSVAYTIIINGKQAIMAHSGDNSIKLATRGNISKEDFLNYNEMRSFDDIIPGRIYYLEHKRNKAMVMFHTVQYDETLWDIAQNYGIKTETIREKNRMDDNEAIEVGRVLWLRSKRPKNKQVEYKIVEKKETPPVKVEKQVEEDTVVVKPKELKQTENIFIHYNNTPKLFLVDSNKYEYTYHDVASGETLFGISRKYQTPTDSLMKWNNLEGYGIKYGQTLIVGINSKIKNTEPLTHTVIKGDTFYKIAHHYNVSVDDLLLWNNKTDMTLKLGEKLIVKKNQP